ncbi:RNase H family protein [Actinomadura sp. NPDC047616]|uniref:RNase H family protein n=1 Tax=Actinomadura sp. NPDC047616 TaxID=3155914 RepID=UPI0033F2F157
MLLTTMPLRQFDAEVALLPPVLAVRVQRMRACATRAYGCDCCGAAREALRLGFAAVRDGAVVRAEELITEAERRTATGPHAAGCPHLPPAPRPVRATDPASHGQVRAWAERGGRLVAATDASWKKGAFGTGYVTSDGRWGMHGRRLGPTESADRRAVLISELRAVALLMSRLEREAAPLLLVDSLRAVRILRAWQEGDVARMPDGYSLRPRRDGAPTLVRLARHVAARRGLRVEHVRAHTGHPLNEAADSLASIARRRITDPLDSIGRAHGLVDAFVRAWHDGGCPDANAA